MVESIEILIERNRKLLIENAQKVLDVATKDNFKENLHYIEQDIDGVFQYGTVLVEQCKKQITGEKQ